MIEIIGSLFIFIVSFIFFVYGRIHRTIVAMTGAASMLIFGIVMGFYSQSLAFNAIDFNTIGLLLGMMIIVNILKRSGLFRYLAIKGVKMAGGDPWKLLVTLGLITAFISMIIDNVTTILLMSPVTLLISDILGISPLPMLLGEVILSNIGGIATLVGDPPNIMIGSASNLTFNSFIVHLMPVSLLAMGVSLFLLKIIFRSFLVKKKEKISQFLKMREEEAIKDKSILVKCVFSLILIVALFATEEFHGLKPSMVALIGAVITLLFVRPDPYEILSEIEWPVLFFFAGLFIIVGGVDHAGVLKILGYNISNITHNPLVLSVIVIWLSAILSAFIDNIPYTAAMIPVIKHLGTIGINTQPLWWALAIGVGLGGNYTPVGSSAGVVVMGLIDKTSSSLTFKSWIKTAGIISLITTLTATLVFIVGFKWFS